jgi:hypothetical protein
MVIRLRIREIVESRAYIADLSLFQLHGSHISKNDYLSIVDIESEKKIDMSFSIPPFLIDFPSLLFIITAFFGLRKIL